MATITRSSGVQIDAPAGVRVSDASPARARRAARGARTFDATPLPLPAPHAAAQAEVVADIFRAQDMQLADALLLEPPPVAAAGPVAGSQRRARGRAATAAAPVTPLEVTLSVDVAPTESAAVLLEQDGYFSWQLPQTAAPPTAARARRRGRTAAAQVGRVEFRIPLEPAQAETAAPARLTGRRTRSLRGIIEQTALGQARAFVFRFAARVVLGSAMAVLERNVRNRLVDISADDPSNWSAVDDVAALALPADRQARILLFLHGTFSSTVGSFGPLGGSPWGRKVLQSCRGAYDLVLGFDHPTLSVDPTANAAVLLTLLQRLPTPQPPRIDVVSYSRGGLVFRAFAEHVLPQSSWRPTLGRAIFIAVPNAGTTLAGSKQWPLLIDLYTNLAVAACRALGWIPQAAAVAPILAESMKGLGALVKYIVTGAAEEDGVPGLAAMKPKGSFITTLNQTQPGQPAAVDTWYAAITSDFGPAPNAQLSLAELPRQLLQRIVDDHVDLLFGGPNDLVVDTPSMTAIDVPVDVFAKQRFEFGKTSLVYHTRYFIQPAVAGALVRWLELPDPLAVAPVRASRRRRAARAPALDQVPPEVDVDVVRAHVNDSPLKVREIIERVTPSHVVVERAPDVHYAFRTEELLKSLPGGRRRGSLGDVLDLHERDVSPQLASSLQDYVTGASLPLGALTVSDDRRPTAGRGIVLLGEGSVGVVSALGDEGDIRALRGLARAADAPRSTGDAVIARRVLPTFEMAAPPATSRTGRRSARGRSAALAAANGSSHPPQPEQRITANVRGECEKEMVIDVPAAVEVMVSREAINATRGRVSGQTAVELDPRQRMVVLLAPRTPCDVIGPGFLTFDPPAPDVPYIGHFMVVPRASGPAELWLVVLQCQTQRALVTLKPNVVQLRAEVRP